MSGGSARSADRPSTARPPTRGSLLCKFVVVAVVGLMVRTWCIQGLLRPLPIAGGSMAPTLLGEHRAVVCADCGWKFDCDNQVLPVSPRAVCPNCGYAANGLQALPDLAGDGVWVDKSVFNVRRPRRWEIVALRLPYDATQLAVKRVVGLPGESVEIRDGDVYIDGQLQRKDYAEQLALAVPVYDADCEPLLSDGLPLRWQGGPQSHWGTARGRFARPAIHDGGSVDWLTYHHWQRIAGQPNQVRPSPITDVCGYNQTVPRRSEDIHPVADVLLSLRLVEAFGQGKLILRITDGRDTFETHLLPAEQRYQVAQNGTPVPAGQGKLPAVHGGLQIGVSLIDRQFLLALDGRPALVRPYQSGGQPPSPSAEPLAIGALGLGVVLDQVQIVRDVYYTRPEGGETGRGFDVPVRLGTNQYYVLGDNSPVSQDSRNWPAAAAFDGHLLLGKPFLVAFPAAGVAVGRWSFQVPDLRRIRYIQ